MSPRMNIHTLNTAAKVAVFSTKVLVKNNKDLFGETRETIGEQAFLDLLESIFVRKTLAKFGGER